MKNVVNIVVISLITLAIFIFAFKYGGASIFLIGNSFNTNFMLIDIGEITTGGDGSAFFGEFLNSCLSNITSDIIIIIMSEYFDFKDK